MAPYHITDTGPLLAIILTRGDAQSASSTNASSWPIGRLNRFSPLGGNAPARSSDNGADWSYTQTEDDRSGRTEILGAADGGPVVSEESPADDGKGAQKIKSQGIYSYK